MPRVVGIHGIAQTYTDSETLASTWHNALCGGLKLSGYPCVEKIEFEMVFYGDLFRKNVATKANSPYGSDKIENEWERMLLESWWREAARISRLSNGEETCEVKTIQSPDLSTKARTPQFVQRALIQLSKTKFFKALSRRDLISTIHQVWAFLHDQEMKGKILERVSNVVKDDTRVIISHSLGSVVAYEAICKFDLELDALITIGSPLGIKNLIFDKLTPAPQNGRGFRPVKVKNWINISDDGDIVALEKYLSPFFDNVVDKKVYNGWHSHDIGRYLSSAVLGQTLKELNV